MFSKEGLKEYIDKNEKVSKKRRTKTYVTQTSEQAKEKKDGSKLIECQICGDGHDADDCSIFNGQTVEERSKTLARKKLCYGCYTRITADHNARNCKTRRTCKNCNQKHPTGFHGYISKKKGINVNNGGDSTKGNDGGDVNTLLQSNFAEVDVKCASTGFPANIISMCVISVKLSHAKTKKEVSTLSMLDNCSQGTFHGVLFTCLVSRAVHIELTKTMDTDSFILTLRRFIARRGNVRSIRCDNGSNFMGAERELAKSCEEMDHRKIKHFMLYQKRDLIAWKRNPSMASHMGAI